MKALSSSKDYHIYINLVNSLCKIILFIALVYINLEYFSQINEFITYL